MRRAGAGALALLVVASVSCGGGGEAARGGPLVVAAAASLREPLLACSGPARLSFAGSDELAAQIRRGVRPDVFAAANTALPDQLAREGRLEAPRTFIGNELVLAVGADRPLRALADVARPGTRLAVGAPGVPVGAYTRAVLARLPPGLRARLRANVRTEEPDVRGVVGKLVQGAADAGFVYVSDARSAAPDVRTIRLPARLRPAVAYGAGVVRGARRPRQARRYLADLAGGRCHAALLAAGFREPR